MPTSVKTRPIPMLRPPLAMALAVFILMPAGARARAQTSGEPSRTIGLLHPGDPGFNAALDANFPGIRAVPGFTQIEPLLAILHSESSHAVQAYNLRWSFSKKDGSPATASLLVLEQSSEQWPLVGQKAALEAVETQLVSPFFNWSAKQFPTMLSQGVVKLLFQSNLSNPLVAEIQASPFSQLTLDGVVFDDGLFTGPDASRLFEQFQAEQQAQVDEAQWVAGQLAHGADQLMLATSLEQQIAKLRSAAINSAPSLYDAALASQANRFYQELRKQGAEAVGKTARKMADAKALKVHR